MDPRVVPEQFLPSARGMAVYRNAGGRPNDDVVRTITVLRSLASKAKQVRVLVIHHTGKFPGPLTLYIYKAPR